MQALYQWQVSGENIAELIQHFRLENDFSKADADYFEELVRQVPMRLPELDQALVDFLDRPVEEVDPVERAILRIAIYEFMHRPDIPYRVVINEAVDLAKMFGAEQGHKYINGVLDQAARRLRALEIKAKT